MRLLPAPGREGDGRAGVGGGEHFLLALPSCARSPVLSVLGHAPLVPGVQNVHVDGCRQEWLPCMDALS